MTADYTEQNVMQWLDEEEDRLVEERGGKHNYSQRWIGWRVHIPRLAKEYGISEERLTEIMRKWGADV